MIGCANPGEGYLAYKKEIDEAVIKVLSNGRYICGEEVRTFETEFAEYTGADYAVGVGSGTDALRLALEAIGIIPGDEVITVSHTAVATVSAIRQCGGIPVFADIDPLFYTIDSNQIENLITGKTKAIIAVHLYGHPADIFSIMKIAAKHDLKVIEDCAQAHGATINGRRVGSIGDIGCFSFYPTKNLGGFGDGGLITTCNSEFAERVKLLREYGWKNRYVSVIHGFNSRLDEVQAAILRVKLRYLDRDNDRRRHLAEIYISGLQDTPLQLPVHREGNQHVYHLFVVRTDIRNELKTFLENQDIFPLIHYPVPVHMQPAYASYNRNHLPQTEQASVEILSLPMYPELPEENVNYVIKEIKAFYDTRS